ncbi:MAG TPA: RIP metalloprotease RseP [Gemmatimonadaceae bacterium]|nr:RIP metalloprotease RseP [Gemmatimonadaceae bacterium]
MRLSWLAPIIVFGLVIFIHELGHFLAAKWAGVYAPRFSVGFGPALWRRRRGETEYILAAVPLGGYVRMASKDDESTAFLEGGGEEAIAREQEGGAKKPKDWDPEAMIPHGPQPIPPNRWFESKPLWQRIAILLAGVTMNLLLGWIVTVGTVAAYGEPYLPAVVDSVMAGRPAAAAGLMKGDSVIAIEGQPITTFTEMVTIVSARPGQSTAIDVVRAGAPRRIVVTPVGEDFTDPLGGGTQKVGRIGVIPRGQIARLRAGPADAVVTGTKATIAMAGSIVGVVRGLLTGNVGVENLAGPIGIARVSVEAAQGGLETLLALIAFLSINIAVLNLLPIPVLDGGQILIHVLEAVKGSPFSPRAREYILRAGLAIILMLLVIVMYNDIRALTLSFLGRS